jgi:hypothetical protein
MQCMRDAVGCCTLLRTGCAWSKYFSFELKLTGKTVWHSIQIVTSSTHGTIWTGLCTHSVANGTHLAVTTIKQYECVENCEDNMSKVQNGPRRCHALAHDVTTD